MRAQYWLEVPFSAMCRLCWLLETWMKSHVSWEISWWGGRCDNPANIRLSQKTYQDKPWKKQKQLLNCTQLLFNSPWILSWQVRRFSNPNPFIYTQYHTSNLWLDQRLSTVDIPVSKQVGQTSVHPGHLAVQADRFLQFYHRKRAYF